ncbi:MAG: NADPH-dependent 7-cyano-7-deazaguanine reductase QueF [Pseudohongiella sp.]|nr:NADPH-dependent 7-cyano-7-deazaguanine reductase QueF [Pseudohongiella sp.]
MVMSEIPLGKQIEYPEHYDPGLLFPVSRSVNRIKIGISDELPFGGFDHWRAYELSWLTLSGTPVVAVADILVPCDSPFLIESKSMKLYFNSLNQHRFESEADALACITRDLSVSAGTAIHVELHTLGRAVSMHTADTVAAELLDTIVITDPVFIPDASLLKCSNSAIVRKTLVSHLFRSNCPITAQPDWGSIVVSYEGPEIDRESLLRYIISFRQHEGFHEHCVEQIFQDLISQCAPERLTVSINFLRRGGLEINPLRSLDRTVPMTVLPRLLRQ